MIIDTCGKLCPMPLIMTKKALKQAAIGDQIEVLTDNETSLSNLKRYLAELGYIPKIESVNGVWHICFNSNSAGGGTELPDIEPFCETTLASKKSSSYIVVIKSSAMGSGDDALGEMLLRAFINALIEADNLPEKVVLYNGGVKVVVGDSDTALSLKKLEERGVDIVSCGTCLDFFGVKEKLSVGRVTNMLDIINMCAAASHIVYP